MRIRVVVADDQALIRTALRTLIESADDLDVVAVAGDGEAAVAAARAYRPDVVVVDIRMPRMDGIEATRRIRELDPGVAVIVLTTYDLDEYVFRAIRAGAVGFLLKDGDADELIRGIRAAAAGEALMAPQALRSLLGEFARTPQPDALAAAAVDRLSGREREVLCHMADGRANDDIARAMFLSVATVKTHVGSVLMKLGVRDRTQAVVTAYRAGLVPMGEPSD
jgi:DNA-binding NarL/FixJ family response regulator